MPEPPRQDVLRSPHPPSARDRLAATADGPALRAMARRLGRWEGVLVLDYHRIGLPAGEPWDPALWSASPATLDEHLAFLAREADVIGPGDIAGIRGEGRRVLITFDDGYRDSHDVAFGLLRRHGLTATFFLVTGMLDDPRVLWWDEISWMLRTSERPTLHPDGTVADVPLRLDEAHLELSIAAVVSRFKRTPATQAEAFVDALGQACGTGRCDPALGQGLWMTWDMARAMRDAGMTFGGHSVTHPMLGGLPRDAQVAEVAGCAARLQAELGGPMRWFAYPVGTPGAFTAITKQVVREQGAELAFAFNGGYVAGPIDDPMEVPRLNVSPRTTPARFRANVRAPRWFVPAMR
jgi:peptidoglycan/xylan/chitin deacetylase (PgdA/CDA1 family)